MGTVKKLHLFDHLEFAGFNDLAGPVAKLVNINATIKICERDIYFRSGRFCIIYFLADEIIYLNGEKFVKTFYKFKIDYTYRGVRIKSYISGGSIRSLGCTGEGKDYCKKKYVQNFIQ